jgi:2-polyprenyl-3-methyl-5-hydroxy-6-metoxy-1,4-benzoquinol methylase
LDAGCGEGKNAIYLARLGAAVRAVDISAVAIRNARRAWGDAELVSWEVADISTLKYSVGAYDLVIAYGLLHCLPDEDTIRTLIERLQETTRPGGYNVICTFNSRSQDLIAHPDLDPTLLSHGQYLDYYRSWEICHESDRDLHEVHPNNLIPHSHSMTRIIARRPAHDESPVRP